jgi:hypothetical protein
VCVEEKRASRGEATERDENEERLGLVPVVPNFRSHFLNCSKK